MDSSRYFGALFPFCQLFRKSEAHSRTYVVSGKYPKLLLREWDEFKRERGSDGVRPDSFTERQLYAIIVLPHAGVDLETYVFNKVSGSGRTVTVWRDAAEIFWQVANALACAEEQLMFEVHTSHWVPR